MCQLITSIKDKNFIGYKIAMMHRKSGTIRSISTMIVYKPGPVLRPAKLKGLDMMEVRRRYLSRTPIFSTVLDPEGDAYNDSFYGRTAVFKDFSAARVKFYEWKNQFDSEQYQLVLVKMGISGRLMQGEYQHYVIIAGDHIDSVQTMSIKDEKD